MRVPNAETAEVPVRKITEYLLALASDADRGKAIFFLEHGFVPQRWQELAEALRTHVLENDYCEATQTRRGTRYVVDGPPQCPDGNTAMIRSIWNISHPPRILGWSKLILSRGKRSEHGTGTLEGT